MTPANTLARTSSRNCSIGATSFRRLAHGGFLSVPHFCVKVKVKCPDSRQKGTVSPVPAPLYQRIFLHSSAPIHILENRTRKCWRTPLPPGRVGYLVLRSLLPLVRDAAKYDPDRHTPPVGVAFFSYSIASPSRVNPRSLSVLYRPVRLSASSSHEIEPFRNSAALVGPNIASCLAGGNVFHQPPKNSFVVPAFRIFRPPVPMLPGSRSTHGRMTRCTSSSGTPQSRGLLVIHCLMQRQLLEIEPFA